MRRTTAVVLSLLAVAGCKKPQPSPEFAEAQSAWSAVTSRLGDDAYSDPEMDRILGLLDKVASDSTDAQAASALRVTIETERKRVAEEDRARKADLAVLHQAAPAGGNDAPPPEAPPVAEAPAPEKGEPTQPRIGMSFADFTRLFGACFSEGDPVNVTNMNLKASSYAVNNMADCGKRHAEFENKLILVADGKLMATITKDSVKTEMRTADAGAAPPPAPTGEVR